LLLLVIAVLVVVVVAVINGKQLQKAKKKGVSWRKGTRPRVELQNKSEEQVKK